jgi:hypothetical protein
MVLVLELYAMSQPAEGGAVQIAEVTFETQIERTMPYGSAKACRRIPFFLSEIAHPNQRQPQSGRRCDCGGVR